MFYRHYKRTLTPINFCLVQSVFRGLWLNFWYRMEVEDKTIFSHCQALTPNIRAQWKDSAWPSRLLIWLLWLRGGRWVVRIIAGHLGTGLRRNSSMQCDRWSHNPQAHAEVKPALKQEHLQPAAQHFLFVLCRKHRHADRETVKTE